MDNKKDKRTENKLFNVKTSHKTKKEIEILQIKEICEDVAKIFKPNRNFKMNIKRGKEKINRILLF